uniref:phage major capsid protein n=1 Tax=Herbidospora sakaeratensis TaxID=564415 RepID=UPI000AA75943|nr:phage major capsid protein [Herbidospora sakaeratensis]
MSTVALQRLIDEQNTIWNRMQELRRGMDDRDLTAEERQNWDEAEARLTVVSSDIERLQRAAQLDTVDRSQVIVAGGGQDGDQRGNDADRQERYSEAFYGFIRRGLDRLTPEQRELLAANFGEVRAQGVGVDSAGGYLVPEGFRNKMTETLVAFGGLMGQVSEIVTGTGNDLPWPTNDDTANIGAILGENTQISEQDLTIGQRKLGAHIYTSKLVRVSLALLQDNQFNLEAWLPTKLGTRIGRAVAAHLCTGTGVGQPEGITVGGTVGKTGAVSATAVITYDDTIDLEHSVNSAYREGGNAKYVFADSMLKLLRKLKDGEGRPIWVPVPTAGFPATINGWSYTVDDGMPAPAPGAKSIAFGDFRQGYVARRVLDVQLQILRERYADYLQVGFHGFARLDGRVDDAAAFRLFQHGAAS